ncbi:MAG: RES family NAD+ phosphorylase [Salibacteraceae bacterium]
MKVYRIERQKYLASTLKGIGPSLTDGFRWNSRNTFLVYSAATRSLALLEVSAHLDFNNDLPTDRYFVEIEIPDEMEIFTLEVGDLTHGWNNKPPEEISQQIGDSFVQSMVGAVLRVPSSIIPQEYNFLINPFHPDAQKIKVVEHQILQFDNRLY